MPDGEDWLWRPVLRGMCRAESLMDGSLTLEALAAMNDYLDVCAENDRRLDEARKPHGR